MTGPEFVLIYSTFPDAKSAETIGRECVEQKLAACVNIIPGMRAIYEWQGKVQIDEEVVVLFKTTQQLQQALIEKLSSLHPYEIPALIGFKASHIEEKYMSWLDAQTRSL